MNHFPIKKSVVATLVVLVFGIFIIFNQREKPPESFPAQMASYPPAPYKQPKELFSSAIADTTVIASEKQSDAIIDPADLPGLKNKVLHLVKDWELSNAKPLTKGYKLGEIAVTLVPPADSELLSSIKLALGRFGNDPVIFGEVVGSSGIITDKYRVLMYTPSQVNASEDTVATFPIERYEDVSLDPITGSLRVTGETFSKPLPGNASRYSHLFKVHEE